jgi:hypothetical protein
VVVEGTLRTGPRSIVVALQAMFLLLGSASCSFSIDTTTGAVSEARENGNLYLDLLERL